MDNQELLAQVAVMMQQQTETIKEYVDGQLNGRLSAQTEIMTQIMDEKVEQAIHDIRLIIENDVSKRIESLFDGYKLTHEKQWEMERATAAMRSQIEDWTYA